MLKRTEMNTDGIPTGKSKLSDVAKLIHARILEIKERSLILMTHHIIVKLFEYLTFKPL